ncbi:MAG TPA: hypothetical protein VF243_04300 [Nitrosospira sp.]
MRLSVRYTGGTLLLHATATMIGTAAMCPAQAQDTGKNSVLPAVIITATPFENRSELDMTQPVSVLRGEDLRRKREASLGDTL